MIISKLQTPPGTVRGSGARVLSALVLAVAGAALLVAGAAVAGDPASSDAPSLDQLEGGAKVQALIQRVVRVQRSLRSLRADFVQVKSSDLLLDPVRSQGRFTFLAPDHVRWDYSDPEGMVVSFADDEVTTYYPDRKRAETIKISRRNRRFVRVLAGTQPLDDLASNFSITLSDPGAPANYKLILDPTNSVLKRRLELVILEIDRDVLLPVVVEYRAADGDTTRYEFRNLVLNPEVQVSDFDLDLGADVRVETLDISSGAG
jgi:outer membrane lipoprotein carrier protein